MAVVVRTVGDAARPTVRTVERLTILCDKRVSRRSPRACRSRRRRDITPALPFIIVVRLCPVRAQVMPPPVRYLLASGLAAASSSSTTTTTAAAAATAPPAVTAQVALGEETWYVVDVVVPLPLLFAVRVRRTSRPGLRRSRASSLPIWVAVATWGRRVPGGALFSTEAALAPRNVLVLEI